MSVIPTHHWILVSEDALWSRWRCDTCPNHHMQFRRILVTRTPDDHKVSTCPRCGNYCGGSCKY